MVLAPFIKDNCPQKRETQKGGPCFPSFPRTEKTKSPSQEDQHAPDGLCCGGVVAGHQVTSATFGERQLWARLAFNRDRETSRDGVQVYLISESPFRPSLGCGLSLPLFTPPSAKDIPARTLPGKLFCAHTCRGGQRPHGNLSMTFLTFFPCLSLSWPGRSLSCRWPLILSLITSSRKITENRACKDSGCHWLSPCLWTASAHFHPF